MNYLYLVTAAAVIISAIADSKKTIKAFQVACRKLRKIIPQFLLMLILISIALFLLPESVITAYLGGKNILATTFLAAMLGSITMMPGFIAFPLCGILLNNGIAYTTLASFSTTLMMVGVLTFPVEKEYFGTRLTVYRNAVSFIIALLVALIIGLAFGEIAA